MNFKGAVVLAHSALHLHRCTLGRSPPRIPPYQRYRSIAIATGLP